MRILFMANAPWAKTGYGTQGKHLALGWERLGHEVGYFAFYGLHGSTIDWGKRKVYPPGLDAWGNDVAAQHARHFKADVFITLMDIWVQHGYGEIPGVAWCPWMPIDHDPIPPRVSEKMWGARRVLTYARFGQRKCAEIGVDADYIPHGIDPAAFCPGDKAAARKFIGLPQEAHATVMVAANKGLPSRKAFPECLAAWARFHKRTPGTVLYLHTLIGEGHQGLNIEHLLRGLGIADGCVYVCDQYRYVTGQFMDDYMAAVYRAGDVLLAASTSEGFGIPILEAQACGMPVITTKFTSMPELTWNGVAVPPVQRQWTPLASWTAVPDIRGIEKALQRVYDWPAAERKAKSEQGVQTAHEQYAWDILIDNHWRPMLDEIAAEIAGTKEPKLKWPDREEWKEKCWATDRSI